MSHISPLFKMARRRRSRRSPQLTLQLKVRSWGGAREGAGRKPSKNKGRVPHRARPVHKAAHPVHVTLRVAQGVRNLRVKRTFEAVRDALEAGASTDAFRLLEYSVQTNHLHLIVEASDNQALARGMQGLNIRLARVINRVQDRKGCVFPQRYHARELTTPREVRSAIAYVLLNSRRHAAEKGPVPKRGTIDPCSSGPWFRGWRKPPLPPPDDSPLPAPRTFLLRKLWRKHGLISPDEIPGPRSKSSSKQRT